MHTLLVIAEHERVVNDLVGESVPAFPDLTYFVNTSNLRKLVLCIHFTVDLDGISEEVMKDFCMTQTKCFQVFSRLDCNKQFQLSSIQFISLTLFFLGSA